MKQIYNLSDICYLLRVRYGSNISYIGTSQRINTLFELETRLPRLGKWINKNAVVNPARSDPHIRAVRIYRRDQAESSSDQSTRICFTKLNSRWRNVNHPLWGRKERHRTVVAGSTRSITGYFTSKIFLAKCRPETALEVMFCQLKGCVDWDYIETDGTKRWYLRR